MTTETTPLLFPEILNATRLDELNALHRLTQADLDWLHHVALPSHTQRAAQTPPMAAETILLQADNKVPIPLAGCFTLKALPDSDVKPAFLYTPDRGIRKFNDSHALENKIDEMLQDTAGRDDLFRYLSISQRSELNSTNDITQTSQIINEDVFKAQIEAIEYAQSLNALAMVDELIKLPTLTSMLDQALNEQLPNFDQRQARVALRKGVPLGDTHAIPVTESIALSDAVLVYFHHQGWPAGHDVDLTHPGTSTHTAQQWEGIIKATARNLIPTLSQYINTYWQANSPFHRSRRDFLARVIRDALRAAILIAREKGQLTEAQNQELLRLFRPSRRDEPLLFIETIRLWEYQPHFVELAGSLMISGKDHYLYTPNHGLQKVANYLGFKDALLNTPAHTEPRQALYNLLSLEERNRFLRFDQPQVSGESVDLPVAETLADGIIAKQLDNLHYALEMSRQGDVNLHSLIDKALDIRTLINKSLLDQKTDGHWGTRPAFYGELRPSNFMADQLERKIKSYTDVEDTFHTRFIQLPPANTAALQSGLDKLLPELTNAFSLGLRAEAELRERDGTLPAAAHDLIRNVFAHDADHPDRTQRLGVRGFRPDVYSLKLTCHAEGRAVSLRLPNCFLLTERGGLDTPYSGMAILWSPTSGLQAFTSVDLATEQLNKNLLNTRKRFAWLSNLAPAQRIPHGRYQLQAYELLEDNVLVNRMKSFIEQFKAERSYLSTLKVGDWKLSGSALRNSLDALLAKGAPTNLKRAVDIAQANRRQQKLPAWLGTASLEDRRLHIELLEQYKNSVVDAKDYLDGIEPLRTHVHKKLRALLDARFPGKNLDPDTLQITPNLAVVGPASALTDFALNHVDVTRNGFKVSSTAPRKLPDGLNETAVRQILSSLDISTAYKTQVVDTLSGSGAPVQQRKRRFRQQLPWQLLQHAHARHLQQHLSNKAFDLIRQVLDMPDAIARSAVEGASALFRPVELIKTGGAAAVKALGLYLVGSSAQATNPLVLYSPYHSGHCFTEFKDEASVVAAFNTPGALQDLLIRRLPENQQAIFRNLFASTLGHLSEITLGSNPIRTNLLDTLFDDNTKLLAELLSSQAQDKRQFDWTTALHLFSSGIRLVGRQLPGKLTFIETLWESYQDFKASSEALQAHDWKTGLHNFIAGAAEMVSLGLLNRDDTFGLLDPVSQTTPATAPLHWNEIASTAPARTDLQAFEATDISLLNLRRNLFDGTYEAMGTGKRYASIAGKVFQVANVNQAWRIVHENGEGPILKKSSDRQKWLIDPEQQTIRYGKVMSSLAYSYTDYKASRSLNIAAKGMAEIRRKYPYHAHMIVQALETARYYSLNALQNVTQLKRQVSSGSRLDTFLKSFFGVDTVDARLIRKIHAAVSPICQALADPSWELQNAGRVVIGNHKHIDDDASAFVFGPSANGRIYLTQLFFNTGLDWYKSAVPEYFDVDAHAQGATLIHEISHQLFNTLDITYVDAALPFLDLISTATHLGQKKYDGQKDRQLNGFSLTTPRTQLFMEWDGASHAFKSLEALPRHRHMVREILKITGTNTMDAARDAFLDRTLPDKRIDLILRNADSLTLLICELGRQLDSTPSRSTDVF